MRRFRHLLFASLLLLAVAGPGLWAADTAFWKPYHADAQTLLLLPGPPGSQWPGRFGQGLGFVGGAGMAAPTLGASTSPLLALEAWVRLTAYSAEGSTVIALPGGPRLRIGADGVPEVQLVEGEAAAVGGARLALNQWQHLAAVVDPARGVVLYVDGAAVGHGAVPRDWLPPPLPEGSMVRVGDQLRGLLDEVRVHDQVRRYWPEPERDWLARIAREGLLPLERVLPPPNAPSLYLSFNGAENRPLDSLEAPPGVTLRLSGTRADGVEGQSLRGALRLALPGSASGTFSLWVRPYSINSHANAGARLLRSEGLTVALGRGGEGPWPLTLYAGDAASGEALASADGIDLFAGKWTHLVLAWDAEGMAMYVDGRAANRNPAEAAATPAEPLRNLVINAGEYFGDSDELLLFPRRLSGAEIANLHARYRGEPLRELAPHQLRLHAWYLPSAHRLYYRLGGAGEADGSVALSLSKEGEPPMVVDRGSFSTETVGVALPRLAPGAYRLEALLERADGETLRSDSVPLLHGDFAWERGVPAPERRRLPGLSPLQVEGREVQVTGRTYTMNGFGLWDQVRAEGRELLAAPMRLEAVLEDGAQAEWRLEAPTELAMSEHIAAWHASAEADAVAVDLLAEVEEDGLMRISLTLKPGPRPARLERLSLVIPLESSVARYLHAFDGSGVAGAQAVALPEREGTLWASTQAPRSAAWLNAFTSYLWIGDGRRGIAWFAENDRGWESWKDGGSRALQRLVRDGDRVTLRIDLVNRPTLLESSREIVFGLQASPVRPMAPLNAVSGEARLTPRAAAAPWLDLAAIEAFAEAEGNPGSLRIRSEGPAWQVYRQEWGLDAAPLRDAAQAMPEPPLQPVNPTASYLAYAASLPRQLAYVDAGESGLSRNPLTSAAYALADGRVQPATTLWNLRAYLRARGGASEAGGPLPAVRMPGVPLLPLAGLAGQIYLPMGEELMGPQAMAARFHAEAVGTPLMPVGELFPEAAVPGSVAEVEGWRAAREWAMRRIHRLPPPAGTTAEGLEVLLWSFVGDAATWHTDRAEPLVLAVDDPRVRWLVVTRPAEREVLVILQSWSPVAHAVELRLDADRLGFAAGGHVVDLLSDEVLSMQEGSLRVAFKGPYGLRMLRISPVE